MTNSDGDGGTSKCVTHETTGLTPSTSTPTKEPEIQREIPLLEMSGNEKAVPSRQTKPVAHVPSVMHP